jgi:hypothetical protein
MKITVIKKSTPKITISACSWVVDEPLLKSGR